MPTTKLAVVILNYNGLNFLKNFLPIVVQFSSHYEIVVADNNSTDASIEFVEAEFPSIKIVRNPMNTGFAQGYNDALKFVEAEYYVLLNSDVEVTFGWIENILHLMENDHKIAACQPKILDFNQRNKFEYAGASGGFIDKYGYPFCRGRVFNHLEVDSGQYNDSKEVFWATGACMFVRAKAYWEVGGFDGDYFAHMEEIDLCWRLKNIGYKIFVEPKSEVYHVGAGTLKVSPRKSYLNFRNNLITLTKNHPSAFLFFKINYRLQLDGIAALKFLLDGEPGHFLAVIKAHFSYYFMLPSTLRKRKKAKENSKFAFNTSMIYSKNIVLEFFIRKKKTFSQLSQDSFFNK